MAQHDYILENASGALFRQDLNNVLRAIVENNMGATPPSTTYSGQWWLDTSVSPARLQLRNNANTAWINCGNLNELSYLSGVTSGIQAQINAKAPIASPALTGTPTAPTAAAGTNTTQIATTAFVSSEVGVANSTLVKTALNASGNAPIYACRAWVNFDGTGTAGYKTGTYVQSGTTVTVTVTNHGYVVGSSAKVDITSGTGVDGTYVVTGVTGANTFTYTAGTSLTTSGNISLQQNAIRASGNVSSITDNGTGDYTVNFTTSMPDENYSMTGTAQYFLSPIYSGWQVVYNMAAPVTGSCRIGTGASTSGSDCAWVNVTIFR